MELRNELLLYAVWDKDRRRWYIDIADVDKWPLPVGAYILTRIDREDRELMLDWAIKKARCGWNIQDFRRALKNDED